MCGEVHFAAFIRDITELKQAEFELQKMYNTISSSIGHASRIQRSVLPPRALLEEELSDFFVLWEPRDVVGGISTGTER